MFLLPASMAGVAKTNGSSSMLAWAFTGIGAMLLALVFANLGRAGVPRTGGPYARKGLGDFIGFWTAWGYWITYLGPAVIPSSARSRGACTTTTVGPGSSSRCQIPMACGRHDR